MLKYISFCLASPLTVSVIEPDSVVTSFPPDSMSATFASFSLPPVSTLTKGQNDSNTNEFNSDISYQYPNDQWLRYPAQGLIARSQALASQW